MVRAKGSTAHPRRGWEQLRECPVCTRGRLVVLQAAALTRQVNGVASHICPWPHESVLGLHSPAKVTPGQCVATEPDKPVVGGGENVDELLRQELHGYNVDGKYL